MSKHHDENKDVKLVSRIAKIDSVRKTIESSRSAVIGIRTWGRIDYLTHYCGYVFIWNNEVKVKSVSKETSDTENPRRRVKKANKESAPVNKKRK